MGQAKKPSLLYLVTLAEHGGAQRYVRDLALALSGAYDVVVAAGNGGWLLDELKQAGGVTTEVIPRLRREIAAAADFFAVGHIQRLLRQHQPNLVHLNSSKAGVVGSLAARRTGIAAVVSTAHGFVFNEPLGAFRRAAYTWLERWSARRIDRIICVSENDRQSALRNRIAPAQKLITIHNGIDAAALNLYPQTEARRILANRYHLPPTTDNLFIGTIAHAYPTKGLDTLIAAAADVLREFPRTVFCIIGEGPQQPALAAAARERKLEGNIRFVGEVADAARLLRAFDVYASSSRKEGLPYSLLEAMAAGLPIAATAVGGVPEMIRHGQEGWLVQPGQPTALANAVRTLLRDRTRAQALGQAAARRVASVFSLSRMIEQTKRCYDELLNARK